MWIMCNAQDQKINKLKKKLFHFVKPQSDAHTLIFRNVSPGAITIFPTYRGTSR